MRVLFPGSWSAVALVITAISWNATPSSAVATFLLRLSSHLTMVSEGREIRKGS